MAKAQKKNPKELSQEERASILNSRLEKFQADLVEDLGLQLGVRLNYSEFAIIPRFTAVPVDQEKQGEVEQPEPETEDEK